MPESRRTRWIVAGPLVAAVALLGACGGDDDDSGSPPGSGPGGGADPAVALVATADVAAGAEVFADNCAQCHGGGGGGGFGPSLESVADELSVEEHVEVVREGRGAMPSWGGSLSDEQIAEVVRFTREGL